MSIDIATARQIVHEANITIGLCSPAADDLVLGTGAQESHYQFVRQLGGGPALGYWQMEPATHDDCWESYLRYPVRYNLATKIKSLLNGDPPVANAMVTNPHYAAAMCRIRYLRVHEPLPNYGDVHAYAAYWKQFYNTPLGAGTIQEFIDNWNRYVGNAALTS